VIGTSVSLDKSFADWVISFERNYEAKDFDWSAFHSQGIALANRLKGEVGDRFKISYRPPYEDPVRGNLPPCVIERE